MSKPLRLKLDGLPVFDSTSLFVSLGSERENQLKEFPNVFERAKAAVRFLQFIGGGIPTDESDRELMQAACLRASLMEFVGMEETLPFDLIYRGDHRDPLKMRDTKNSLLIILRELRHLNLHLENIQLLKGEVEAVNYTLLPEPYRATLKIETIPFRDLLKIKTLRNAQAYHQTDLDSAILWFDSVQRRWGIGDVVKKGIEVYSDFIVAKYH